MANDEHGEKTEEPTERRRREAREKGNVARSTDLSAAIMMLTAAGALYFFGGTVVRSLMEVLHRFLSEPHWLDLQPRPLVELTRRLTEFLGNRLLPFMLLLTIAAIASNVLQFGFLMTAQALTPQWGRLNPIEGAKRILSIRSLVKLGVSLGKLVILVAIAGGWIAWQIPYFLSFTQAEPGVFAREVGESLITLALWLSLALILLALLDFAFQKWKYEEDLKMSKQEVREEMKQMQGDPQTRQRRKDAHEKLAQARELQQVQDADVVITNPTEIAVALKYDPETMPAPQVVAKGMGEIADRIRRIAVENGIPIIERKPLARALYRDVKTGQTIPVEMYDVFVEIMAYVYRLSGKTPPGLT